MSKLRENRPGTMSEMPSCSADSALFHDRVKTIKHERTEKVKEDLCMAGDLYAILQRAEGKISKDFECENKERCVGRLMNLHSVFGDVVCDGLKLGEHGVVNVVRTEDETFPSLYEVRSSNSSETFFLYPDVNFCRCVNFQQKDIVSTLIILGPTTIFRSFLFYRRITFCCVRNKSATPTKRAKTMVMLTRRVLCVAEKNDAAKNISAILSKGQMVRREGRSRFNKLYCFELENCLGFRAQVHFTSVSGHLLQFEFGNEHRNWDKFTTEALFSAQIHRTVNTDMKDIEMTLREQSRPAEVLIIWTDCDREGENIGAEIAGICRNQNPNIDIYRAKFSEITVRAVFHAMANLTRLDERVVAAVDCRTELDLRIGATFTRLQTLHLKNGFAAILPEKVISYGSCQFPTLGFVVERYKAIKEFVAESFWRLVGQDGNHSNVPFVWHRVRLFDEQVTEAFLELCTEAAGSAKVTKVDKHPKSKWRPVALDTVELEKCGIRFLRMTAKRAMMAAEKLYSNGFISYPRTETNKYPKNFDLSEFVNIQCGSNQWGDFATEIMNRGGPNPRNGVKSDEAHPPIHPLKFATKDQISTPDEWAVYEFVVRHFLACVSLDAKGQETKVNVEIGGELFTATGLTIQELGYMRVYPYDKWSDKNLPNYDLYQSLPNFKVTIATGQTTPPQLLSEADLIALMDKYGIGTDATHAEHIEKIKHRCYVAPNHENRFVPSFLGLALVDSYNRVGYEMSKPNLRASLESQLVDICNGTRTKEEVLTEQLGKYRRIFQRTEDRINTFSDVFRQYLNSRNNNNNNNNNER